jgi:hypothetical protein
MKWNAEKTLNVKVKTGFMAPFSAIVTRFVSKKSPIILRLVAMLLL